MNSYQYVKRHITVNGKPTTIAIEKLYWSAIDAMASQTNQPADKLTTSLLKAMPDNYSSRAGWLRFAVTGKLFLQVRQLKAK